MKPETRNPVGFQGGFNPNPEPSRISNGGLKPNPEFLRVSNGGVSIKPEPFRFSNGGILRRRSFFEEGGSSKKVVLRSRSFFEEVGSSKKMGVEARFFEEGVLRRRVFRSSGSRIEESLSSNFGSEDRIIPPTFDIRVRKSQNPPSSMSEKPRTSASSSFGSEDRRTPPSSIFRAEN